MREIKERAKDYIDAFRAGKAVKIITDLLAELERVEGLAGIPTDRIAEPECHKNACQQVIADRDRHIAELESENAWMESLNHTLVLTVQDTRQQAAMECVEIAEAMHVDEYGNGQCGEIVNEIKAHFGLEG